MESAMASSILYILSSYGGLTTIVIIFGFLFGIIDREY